MADHQVEYWVRKLEALKKARQFDTYTELAKHLGISRQGLAHVRRGRQELPIDAKLRVLRDLRVRISQSDYVRLFPPGVRPTIAEKIDRIYDPHNGKRFVEGFWAKRIDQLKDRVGVESDGALAQSLSIPATMISQVRKGKDGLSLAAKLRVLDKLGYTAARNLLLDLLPRKMRTRLEDYDNLRFVARDAAHRGHHDRHRDGLDAAIIFGREYCQGEFGRTGKDS